MDARSGSIAARGLEQRNARYSRKTVGAPLDWRVVAYGCWSKSSRRGTVENEDTLSVAKTIEEPHAIARPFLKMAGGKTSLLQEILRRLPQKISTYYEPFVGGGAVFFALVSEKRFKRAILGDTNEELMLAYRALLNRSNEVVRDLKKHVYDEKYYYGVRGQDPLTLSPSQRAARLIYLNKTCFNGLWRVNKKGEFNVPFGDYKNPTICDEENLRAVADVLHSVSLVCLDFKDVVAPVKPGDTVYFDPPYAPVSETSNFTSYAKGGFTADDQDRLRNCFRDLDERGVHVLLSNSDTPLVRKLYKGFRIEGVTARRNINSKGGKRGKVGELLISGSKA
jgi:DNA adenine methylase